MVLSIVGGEVYALVDGFQRAFIIRHGFDTILRIPIPPHMLTDSRQMFDAIAESSCKT